MTKRDFIEIRKGVYVLKESKRKELLEVSKLFRRQLQEKRQ